MRGWAASSGWLGWCGAWGWLAAAGAWAGEVEELPPLNVVASGPVEGGQAGVPALVPLRPAADAAVLVNSQGGQAAQSDLSIRGSSFSGAGLSLNGLALRNPQTEHFHAELPLPAHVLGAPQLLTGWDGISQVDGHLAGTLAFDTAPLDGGGFLGAGVGERSRNWQDLVYESPLPSPGAFRLGGGLFAGHETADGLDYRDNDLDRFYGGGRLQSGGDGWQADLLGGRQSKEFGARGYYGVQPDWFAEEKLDDTLVLGSARRLGAADGAQTRATAAWRQTEDDYRIFWDRPGTYANQHRATVLAGAADGRTARAGDADLTWRVGGEDETLRSSQLGDHDRGRGGILLLPAWYPEPWTLSAGLKSEVFTGDSPAYLPQAGARYAVAEHQVLFASYTESVRQPSFTELNYESPGSLGNQGLERQSVRAGELGWQGRAGPAVEARAAGFLSRSWHTVDWVRDTPAATRWVATDLGAVDTLGAECSAAWQAAETLALRAGYMALRKQDDADVYAGRYVLDYPEHNATLDLDWLVRRGVRLNATQGLRWQAEHPLRTTGDTALDAAVALTLAVPRTERAAVTLRADNLWDEDFEIFPGQPVAGRRTSAALTVAW